MKRAHGTIPAIVLILLSSHLPTNAQVTVPGLHSRGSNAVPRTTTAPSTVMCSVKILSDQPDYLYTVPQIQEMVQRADVVVRAAAVDSLPRLPYDSVPPSEAISADPSEIIVTGYSEIRFRPIEVLRGPFPATEFTYQGIVADGDDFNRLPVPYRMVRSAGQRGDCYAKDYRLGAEYLFLLQRRDDALTPHWFPLGPTNEQIRGDDDPWLQWVREQLAEDPGPEGRPPLR